MKKHSWVIWSALALLIVWMVTTAKLADWSTWLSAIIGITVGAILFIVGFRELVNKKVRWADVWAGLLVFIGGAIFLNSIRVVQLINEGIGKVGSLDTFLSGQSWWIAIAGGIFLLVILFKK